MPIPRRVAVTEVNHWHSSYDAAYLQVLRDLDVDIVGVSDADAALAEDRARRFESRAFADYRAMIDETKPDFVVALGRHIDMPAIARFLIEADIPFMMEKPMGTTAEDVNALADLAEARGAWAAVPFPNRLLPWAVRAKAMIEAGEFGQISHVVMRLIRPTMQRYVEWDSPWMWDRELAGGGALLNLGGHGMDLARMLLGPDVSVATAVISNRVHQAQVEDYALATLRNGDGALIHVEVGYTWPTWPANESDLEFKVAGEKAASARGARWPAGHRPGTRRPVSRRRVRRRKLSAPHLGHARARRARRPAGHHHQGLRQRHAAGPRRLPARRTPVAPPQSSELAE